MALSKLDQLYRQVILEEASHPAHHGTLASKTHEIVLRNPSCGDVLSLQLEVQDGLIKDLAFSGSGCTISQASASLMTKAVLNQPVAEIADMVAAFSNMIISGDVPESHSFGDAAVLVGVHQFPARIKCATLAWKAVAQALTEEQHD